MSRAIKCDQCEAVGKPGRWGWAHVQERILEPSGDGKHVDFCSRACLRAYFAGPCPSDPGADYHDYVPDDTSDPLGGATCSRCATKALPLRSMAVK